MRYAAEPFRKQFHGRSISHGSCEQRETARRRRAAEILSPLRRNHRLAAAPTECTVDAHSVSAETVFRGNLEAGEKSEILIDEAASDGVGSTAERLTSHPAKEDGTADHKGAHNALEQEIAAQRAKLISAHAVQNCLYEVLLYADGEDAVIYAEAARVVATLIEGAVDKLDCLHLRRVIGEAEAASPSTRDRPTWELVSQPMRLAT